ncbi:hypothetical protein CHARACLAT_028087 [Characodon lateralis]|uniref:Uncharacterized protein n=1 Tax=Characodon lateralis TaxID=208331 RepID=A0ABU7DP82_9TELE|nr:hypothetical protein [Characodon lateralis]
MAVADALGKLWTIAACCQYVDFIPCVRFQLKNGGNSNTGMNWILIIGRNGLSWCSLCSSWLVLTSCSTTPVSHTLQRGGERHTETRTNLHTALWT